MDRTQGLFDEKVFFKYKWLMWRMRDASPEIKQININVFENRLRFIGSEVRRPANISMLNSKNAL